MEKSVFKADSRRTLVTIVSSNLFATLHFPSLTIM
jgi:hypothetical protein